MEKAHLKQLFILALLFLFAYSTKAQDLIVTNENDSLNCKITRIQSGYIYFTFKHKEEIRNTLLLLDQVNAYQYNYFQTSEISEGSLVYRPAYPRFRAAVNGGWSYRTAKLGDNIPYDFQEYAKELKSGYHYGLDISYFFTEQLGLGFKYHSFHSKNELNNIYVQYPNGDIETGKMSDDISINFIGPTFTTRFLNANKRNSFLLGIGMGYMGYKNDGVLVYDYTINGSTLGFCWDIGYDIGLTENFALGFQFSYLAGVLSRYEESFNGGPKQTVQLEVGNYESLSRIELSVGLRFNK